MNKPIRIGNLYGENRGTGFAGNIWETEGISPALTTMRGGGNPIFPEMGSRPKRMYQYPDECRKG